MIYLAILGTIYIGASFIVAIAVGSFILAGKGEE